ncbi:MAG TPA: hypothetical protein VJ884_04000 [Salinibacter sp.]|nr:hypothetical protein [Salinibacter sp.]
MTAPGFYVADDGEVVGLLRRFSARFNLTPASVLECLRERAPRTVLLDAGEGRHRLIALQADGLLALHECASSERLPTSRS